MKVERVPNYLSSHTSPRSHVLLPIYFQTFGLHANGITDIDLRHRGLRREHLPVVIAAMTELPVLNLMIQGADAASCAPLSAVNTTGSRVLAT